MSIYYEDEYVQLFLGDCLTEHREWLDADVLVTDPPYGIKYTNTFGEVRNDLSTHARDQALSAWGTRPSITFGTWKAKRPPATREVLVWDKGEYKTGGALLPWASSHEEIYIRGDWPPVEPGGRTREGGKPARDTGVFRVSAYNNQSSERPAHPTPKPIPLMESLIMRCPPGTIADPFSGSGSTLIAARNLGRKAIGVELEERYCEIIAKRLSQGAFDFTALEAT